MHLDIIKVFYSPTDTQVNCLKNYEYIKIYIKTTRTCFSAVTPSSANALFVLAKTLGSTDNALTDVGVTALKHVEAVLM